MYKPHCVVQYNATWYLLVHPVLQCSVVSEMCFFILLHWKAFAQETVCIVHFSVLYSATWYFTVFIGASCIAMCCCVWIRFSWAGNADAPSTGLGWGDVVLYQVSLASAALGLAGRRCGGWTVYAGDENWKCTSRRVEFSLVCHDHLFYRLCFYVRLWKCIKLY